MKLIQTIENNISFQWNGRTYSYNGDVELVPENVVNGLMGQRVWAHKRWARGGRAFAGILRGAITVTCGPHKTRSMVYLVERDEDKRIFQAVNIKSFE